MIWADITKLSSYAKSRCRPTPVQVITVFTDGSSKPRKPAMVWKPSQVAEWQHEVKIVSQGSTQVIELVAVNMALSRFKDEPINLVTNSFHVAEIIARLDHSTIKDVENPLLMAELWMLWFLIDQRKHDFYVMHV